ncbi:MFS transporter [Desulforamulus ruminis]|uniref:Major facilitator superfamily MFS_1 n=1 Tax=Desulforamulus ruminis (strain ATCC 23193 / DSM 2154 / NCIMB 8452 / DL) TaxID=696281 RepID=F6DQZ3_DESRL|nr:MFS transporter [Desulforamulus ruminis]AEG58717.1 major facilitator superfamily MFS_1 [Desulforamulus ruminis DSM 2154]
MAVVQRQIGAAALQSKLWTFDFVILCLSCLMYYFSFHSLIPTLPVYIQTRGGSEGMAGLSLAALTVSAVMIRPVTGWALDKYGRKRILLSGLLIFLIPSVFYTFMLPIVPLLLFRFMQGFGWGIGSTSQGALASDIIPRGRLGEGLGFFSLITSISLAAAPAMGLWLVEQFSFRTLFIISVLLTLASLLLSLKIRYPEGKSNDQTPKFVLIEKQALGPSLIMLLITIAYSSLLSFLALFIQQRGMSAAGVFFAAFAVTTFISRPLSGKIADRKGSKGYDLILYFGLLAIIASMIVIARTSSLGHLIGGGILFGLGFGSVQPILLLLAIKSVPAARSGAANATYWTAFDIGVAVGSVFWGIIANYFGYVTMYYLNIIPPLLALMLYYLNKKRIQGVFPC